MAVISVEEVKEMSVQNVRMNKSTKIKWLLTLVCTGIIYLIPTNEVYTKQMSLFFTVTAFSLFLMAFEFFEPIVVSIIMPMAWVALGVTDAANAMSGFMNTIVPMCAGAYFMANALSECGLLKRIALIVIEKCGGSWLGLLFGIFLAGVAVSIVTFGLSYIILAALCIGIIKSMGIKMASRESALICMACILGVCSSRTFIYAPSTYAIVIQQGQLLDPSFNISPVEAFTHNIPMFLVSIIILFVTYKVWKTDYTMQSKEFFKNELSKMGKMSRTEKKACVFLILFFAMLVSGPWTGIDANLLFALFPWVLLLPGINVATSKSIRELNWQNLFFIASCMAIGTVASSMGLGQIIADLAEPYMSGAGLLGFFAIIFLITFALNFLMTPLAIWSLITLPLMQIALDIGMNVRPVAYALVMSSEAILMPYEYVPYLIVFSFGMIKMGDFIKMNALKCVITLIGILCIQIPYWMLIGVL